jgi:excisionase family DNA binding protein
MRRHDADSEAFSAHPHPVGRRFIEHPGADCHQPRQMSSFPNSATKLLTPADAAEFLTLRESTLRDYARRGIVPSVKLGRHLRFVEADLVAYLECLRHPRGMHAQR